MRASKTPWTGRELGTVGLRSRSLNSDAGSSSTVLALSLPIASASAAMTSSTVLASAIAASGIGLPRVRSSRDKSSTRSMLPSPRSLSRIADAFRVALASGLPNSRRRSRTVPKTWASIFVRSERGMRVATAGFYSIRGFSVCSVTDSGFLTGSGCQEGHPRKGGTQANCFRNKGLS